MKKTILTIVILLSVTLAFAQQYKRPSEGKSLVYFVRLSDGDVPELFKYFDGEKYLGKMGVGYFTYECNPGEHLFWAYSFNRDYIEGNLKPNATYIIEVKAVLGVAQEAVKLVQITPSNQKRLKKLNKRIKKRETKLKGQNSKQTATIRSGLKKYEKLKHKNKIATLNPNATF